VREAGNSTTASIPALGKTEKNWSALTDFAHNTCYTEEVRRQIWTHRNENLMQVSVLWRALLVRFLSFFLMLYCHLSHFLGRYRQEQYP